VPALRAARPYKETRGDRARQVRRARWRRSKPAALTGFCGGLLRGRGSAGNAAAGKAPWRTRIASHRRAGAALGAAATSLRGLRPRSADLRLHRTPALAARVRARRRAHVRQRANGRQGRLCAPPPRGRRVRARAAAVPATFTE
jgi:hypothetical protein